MKYYKKFNVKKYNYKGYNYYIIFDNSKSTWENIEDARQQHILEKNHIDRIIENKTMKSNNISSCEEAFKLFYKYCEGELE